MNISEAINLLPTSPSLPIEDLTLENLSVSIVAFTRENMHTPNAILLPSDIFVKLTDMENFFDPETKFEKLAEGRLGTILGLTVLSSAYSEPADRHRFNTQIGDKALLAYYLL